MAVLRLPEDNRTELGFLLVAAAVALLVPLIGQLQLGTSLALLGWFVFCAGRLARGSGDQSELVGVAARVGGLPRGPRRRLVAAMFACAVVTVLLGAGPFATNLVRVGSELGVDHFLVVQWLGPLASEAPELIVAVLLAARGRGAAALVMLLVGQFNQWTLLLGALPLAHLLGGGGPAIALDARQTSELFLTAAQTLTGAAVLLTMVLSRRTAAALFGAYLLQLALTDPGLRVAMAGIHLAVVAVVLVQHRRALAATMRSIVDRGSVQTC